MLKSTTYLREISILKKSVYDKEIHNTHVLRTLKSTKFSKQVIVAGGINVMVDSIPW